MNIKENLRKANAVFTTTALFILTLMIWMAYLSGDWMLTMNFNARGEGLLELVLLSLGSVNAVYWFIQERNGRITHDYKEKIRERYDKVSF